MRTAKISPAGQTDNEMDWQRSAKHLYKTRPTGRLSPWYGVLERGRPRALGMTKSLAAPRQLIPSQIIALFGRLCS